MKFLYVIPARGGSKRIPNKNIKLFDNKPLIYYSIDVARSLTTDEHICVSTDDDEIIKVVEEYGLKVPFKRPQYLADDEATTNDVLLHVISYYESLNKYYDVIVLLQPTSPLRKAYHVQEAISLFDDSLDMVVSVKENHSIPLLCYEDNGFLKKLYKKPPDKRLCLPKHYEYNGAIYVINVKNLVKTGIAGFAKNKKYLMDELFSIDIDTTNDFIIAELLKKHRQ